MFRNNKLLGSYIIDKTNYMHNFYINKIFRGNKYSNNLIRHCVDTHGNNFNNPLSLHVNSNNNKAIYLYEKHGFCIDERIPDSVTKEIYYKMIYRYCKTK